MGHFWGAGGDFGRGKSREKSELWFLSDVDFDPTLRICAGIWSAKPTPENGVGKGELEFAAVFPQEERKVLPANQTEGGGKKLSDRGEGIFQPAGAGGEFRGPGVGGGEQEQTAGAHQTGQDFQKKLLRIFDPVKEVGGENEVKSSKFGQAQSVASPEADALSYVAGGGYHPNGLGEVAFLF